MRLMPKDKQGRIDFCRGRLARWAERATEIGTTPEQVAELTTLTQEANAALAAQLAAQRKARAATIRLNEAIDQMTNHAQAIILQVRAKASQAGRGIYPLALIDPPQQPSPIAAPGCPNGFKVEMQQTGQITLTWTCRNPRGSQGTIYQLYRSLDGGESIYIGTTGKKKFFDATVPPGTASVTYKLRAERSTRVGPWASYTFYLGTPAGQPQSMFPPPTQRNAA